MLVHVQLATLTHTKHTYMWVKSKNTTYCMQQNASTECKSATKANQLYKEFLVTGTAFCIWKLELFCTRLKRNQIFAEQWNSSSKKCTWLCCKHIKRLLQGYMNGCFYMILILGKNICQYMQGSALHKHRTFLHCDFPLHEHTRSRRNSADMFPSK